MYRVSLSLSQSLKRSLAFLLFINMSTASTSTLDIYYSYNSTEDECTDDKLLASPKSQEKKLSETPQVTSLSCDQPFKLGDNDAAISMYSKLANRLGMHNVSNKSPFNKDMHLDFLIAVASSKIKKVRRYVKEYKVDINYQDEKNGETALIKACKKGFVGIAHYLLRHGAGIHYEDGNYVTALSYAMMLEREKASRMIQILLLYALAKQEQASDLRIKKKRIAWRKAQKIALDETFRKYISAYPFYEKGLVNVLGTLKLSAFKQIIPHMKLNLGSQFCISFSYCNWDLLEFTLKKHIYDHPKNECSYCEKDLFKKGAKIRTCKNCQLVYYCSDHGNRRKKTTNKKASVCQKRDWVKQHGVKRFTRESEDSDYTLVRYCDKQANEYYDVPKKELLAKYPTENHALSLCALLCILKAYAVKNNL